MYTKIYKSMLEKIDNFVLSSDELTQNIQAQKLKF